jgi:TPR repeat protein
MYKNATGTNKDIIKSIEWLKKGVEEELSSAIYEMSRRLYTGDEIGQNIEEAKKLMQVAADAGDEKALEAIESNFKDME